MKGKLANGVGSQYLSLPRNLVYPALLPLMRTPRLPVVDWTDAPADLNGLVRFAERQNLVSARVPSHFKRSLVVVAAAAVAVVNIQDVTNFNRGLSINHFYCPSFYMLSRYERRAVRTLGRTW